LEGCEAGKLESHKAKRLGGEDVFVYIHSFPASQLPCFPAFFYPFGGINGKKI
jgi:hypothetical protein